jgi:hypothetical protein
MLSWGVIGYGAAVSAVAAAVLVAVAGRERRPTVLVCAAASALLGGGLEFDPACHPRQPVLSRRPDYGVPISWQDTGSGVFAVAVATVLLGFGPVRAEPARRLVVLAMLAGVAALLVDIYLY